MKTVVKAISERRVVDGWGNETVFRRPLQIRQGYCYIFKNGSILRELKTQEELMANAKENLYVLQELSWYEKYL